MSRLIANARLPDENADASAWIHIDVGGGTARDIAEMRAPPVGPMAVLRAATLRDMLKNRNVSPASPNDVPFVSDRVYGCA